MSRKIFKLFGEKKSKNITTPKEEDENSNINFERRLSVSNSGRWKQKNKQRSKMHDELFKPNQGGKIIQSDEVIRRIDFDERDEKVTNIGNNVTPSETKVDTKEIENNSITNSNYEEKNSINHIEIYNEEKMKRDKRCSVNHESILKEIRDSLEKTEYKNLKEESKISNKENEVNDNNDLVLDHESVIQQIEDSLIISETNSERSINIKEIENCEEEPKKIDDVTHVPVDDVPSSELRDEMNHQEEFKNTEDSSVLFDEVQCEVKNSEDLESHKKIVEMKKDEIKHINNPEIDDHIQKEEDNHMENHTHKSIIETAL